MKMHRWVSRSFPRVFFKLARLMKKHVFSLGLMLVAALAFTNCAKQEVINDTPEQPAVSAGVPFELTAGMDTKTEATDAGVITWKTGDALAVFHAEAGSTTYSKNDKFTFDSGSSFKGELQDGALTADAYDWYALYPYYYSIPAPDNITTGYTTFAASQTQTGNNSMAHLCGSNVPMYGKATGVAKDTKPTITMNQAASIIKVHVTNAIDGAIAVTSVAFTAPVNIVGNYFINFAGAQPSFTETGTPKETATLTVKEGDTIAKNGTADFYIVVKPFEAAANDEITVSVNGYKKTIELASAVTFAPGKIKTINFNYDKVIPVFQAAFYELASSIAAGDEIIFASGKTGSVQVMKQFDGTSNNYKTESANVTAGKIYSTEPMGIYTVAKSGDDYTFFDYRRETYLNATNTTSSNYLKESDDVDEYAKFSVEFSDDTPTVKCTGKASRNILKYNTSGMFSCYSSGQNPVYIYKKVVTKAVSSITVTTAPTKTDYTVGEELDMTGAVITATYDDATTGDVTALVSTDAEEVLAHAGNNKAVTVSFMGKTATFNVNVAKGEAGLSFAKTAYTVSVNADFATPVLANPHGLTVTYSSSDDDLVLVDENTGEIAIGNTAGGPVTITASTTGNADYNAGSASYTITISATPVNATLNVDFESAVSAYTDWTITNLASQQTNAGVTAHGGSYFGSTNGKASGSIQTKNKIAKPQSIVFYISKTSTNTTASSWIVEVSTNGTDWTQVGDKQSASADITKGEWTEVSRDLSSYANVYVRVRYDGTTATRCIDDITLTYLN